MRLMTKLNISWITSKSKRPWPGDGGHRRLVNVPSRPGALELVKAMVGSDVLRHTVPRSETHSQNCFEIELK